MNEESGQRGFASAGAAIRFGMLRFTIVSLAAYGIWAFGPKMGAPVLYSSIAVAYVGLSGLLIHGLLEGPRTLVRWSLIFVPGFLLYAVFWCAGWFGLGGHVGEVFGSAAGLFFLARTIGRGVGAKEGLLEVFAVLFLFHTLGYYLGDMLYTGGQGHTWLAPLMDSVSGGTRVSIARLLWGLAHGSGFGAGLGYAFWRTQRSAV